MGALRILRRKMERVGDLHKKVTSTHLPKEGCVQKNYSLTIKQRKGMNKVKWEN